MDIELSLRELLALRDPGTRFTDSVMSRVGDARVGEQRNDVVRLVDARAHRRSRRILLVTVAAVVAAAAVPTVMLRDRGEPEAVRDASSQPASTLSVASSGSGLQFEPSLESPDKHRNPLDCLDVDVIRGLLLQGAINQKFSVTGDLPVELATFKSPRQLTLVGSSERTFSGSGGRSTLSVVYRSDMKPDVARAAGAKALAAGGWNLRSGNEFPMFSVFKAKSAPMTGETWCREGRPVAISASEMEGVTYVILSMTRGGGSDGIGNACEQPARLARTASLLDGFMPTLELPDDPVTGHQVSMRGGGTSNGELKRSTNASFTSKDSVGNVAQHFARQMTEQGWSNEANWNGATSAGSTWTRRADDETILQGMLMVSAFDEGHFTTVFNVVQAK